MLAAASAVGVAAAALRGTGTDTTAAGAAGAAFTLTGGGIARAKRHRGHHRTSSANPPTMDLRTDALLQPAVAAAMSTPPVPATPIIAPITSWACAGRRHDRPALARPPPRPRRHPRCSSYRPARPRTTGRRTPWSTPCRTPWSSCSRWPALEPDLAGGSIDDRVFAAFDAERRHLDAAALANGRHAATTPTDAAAPRNAAYRSKHSA